MPGRALASARVTSPTFKPAFSREIACLLFSRAGQVGHGHHFHGRHTATSACSPARRVGNSGRHREDEANRGVDRDSRARRVILLEHRAGSGIGLGPRDFANPEARVEEQSRALASLAPDKSGTSTIFAGGLVTRKARTKPTAVPALTLAPAA